MTDPTVEAIQETRLQASADLGRCIAVVCGTVSPLEVVAVVRSALELIVENPPSRVAPADFHLAYQASVDALEAIKRRVP